MTITERCAAIAKALQISPSDVTTIQLNGKELLWIVYGGVSFVGKFIVFTPDEKMAKTTRIRREFELLCRLSNADSKVVPALLYHNGTPFFYEGTDFCVFFLRECPNVVDESYFSQIVANGLDRYGTAWVTSKYTIEALLNIKYCYGVVPDITIPDFKLMNTLLCEEKTELPDNRFMLTDFDSAFRDADLPNIRSLEYSAEYKDAISYKAYSKNHAMGYLANAKELQAITLYALGVSAYKMLFAKKENARWKAAIFKYYTSDDRDVDIAEWLAGATPRELLKNEAIYRFITEVTRYQPIKRKIKTVDGALQMLLGMGTGKEYSYAEYAARYDAMCGKKERMAKQLVRDDATRRASPQPHTAISFAKAANDKRADLFAQRYVLWKKLGGDSLALTYLAVDTRNNGTEVDVRILRKEKHDKTSMQHFENEWKALRILRHSQLPAPVEYACTDHTPYIVTKHIDGTPLNEYCDRVRLRSPDRTLPEEEALYFAEKLLRLTEHCHDSGACLRQLSLKNVLLLPDSSLRLLNYSSGSDKVTESMNPFAACVINKRTDIAYDVNSVALLIHEMLTGRKFFATENANPSVSASVRSICNKASLMVYASTDELRADLDKCKIAKKKPEVEAKNTQKEKPQAKRDAPKKTVPAPANAKIINAAYMELLRKYSQPNKTVLRR